MSGPGARVTLTREQIEVLRWYVIIAQREDIRLAKKYPDDRLGEDARGRLAHVAGIDKALYGARFPLSARERALARAAFNLAARASGADAEGAL